MQDSDIDSSEVSEIVATAVGVEPDEFDGTTELGADGLGVDSITIVEIVERIEMQMGVEIPDEELDKFSGGTVSDLQAFVREQTDASV